MNSTRHPVGNRVKIFTRGKKLTYIADFFQAGKHCKESLHTSNFKAAVSRAMEIEVRLEEGKYSSAPKSLQAEEAIKKYVEYLETEDRAPKTLCRYKGILRNLLQFLQDSRIRTLNQVKRGTLDAYRTSRKVSRGEDKPLHPKTLYTESVVIIQFFNWAHSRELLASNPLQDYKLKKPEGERKASPTLDEVNTILGAMDDRRRRMIAALAFTGMRVGELKRLQPRDVDLVGGWIRIESRTGLRTKTRKSRRIPIHPRLREYLAPLFPTTKPWVFTQLPSPAYPDGGHWIIEKKLNEDFQTILKRIGLPTGRRNNGFVIHSLRHFFETFTVDTGIPQPVIDLWMGHSNRSMGMNYYSLKDEESQRHMRRVPFETKPALGGGQTPLEDTR